MKSPTPTPPHTAPPDSVAAEGFDRIGDYELLELLGKGGMGSVFKARQVSLERIVALKILPADLARNQTFTLRFLREARASGKLIHPNVVQGIDCAQDEHSGLWYFAMEYIDGYSLADDLKRRRNLSEERVIEIGMAIAGALEEAAKHGIVHRDIKPENILISQAGEIKLADLGVAKISADEDAALTRTEDMVGTPYYVSPEQARGKRDQIDTRSDIYSLGATLFHLATGAPPFEGETCADIMVKHIQEKPPQAHQVEPTVSEALSRVINKMLQKPPAMRYQTPTEVREALDRARLGVFVGRGETTRVGTVSARRATGSKVAARQSSGTIEVIRQRTSRHVQPTKPGTPSGNYLRYGLVAIFLSIAALVGFLCLENARPSDPSTHASSPPGSVDAPPSVSGMPQTHVPAQPTAPLVLPRQTEKVGETKATDIPAKKATANVAVNTPPASAPHGKPVPGLDGWYTSDVGNVEVAGTVTVEGKTITLKASGIDIWNNVDEGLFVYRCLRGDGSLSVRVNSIQRIDPWSKVGVMFRESLNDDARNAYTFISAQIRTLLAYRSGNRDISRGTHGPVVPFPAWVRLTREGNAFTSFVSADGKDWTRIGSVLLPMGRDVYACLAATSHLDGSLSTIVVEQLTFQGTPTPPAEWPAPKK